jgi:diketogulonate reductase-like aldo/keto reductase
MGYEGTKASIESSFKQTGLDYIDLCVLCCLSRFTLRYYVETVPDISFMRHMAVPRPVLARGVRL